MLGSQSRVIELFENRFEPAGTDFIFRSSLKSPGVEVSRAEKDRFVADFKRGVQIGTWTVAGLVVLLIVGLAFFAAGSSKGISDVETYLVVGTSIGVFLVPFYWFWYAPARALQGRLPATDGRSKEVASQIALRRLTWGRIGAAIFALAVLLFRIGSEHNLLQGWYRLWLVAAAVLLLLFARQAYRKWKAGPEAS